MKSKSRKLKVESDFKLSRANFAAWGADVAASVLPFFVSKECNQTPVVAAHGPPYQWQDYLPGTFWGDPNGAGLKLLRAISRRPNEPERRRFLDLQKRRDTCAAELGIDATLIASRATLSDLAHNWEKHAAELMTWQRSLLGG